MSSLAFSNGDQWLGSSSPTSPTCWRTTTGRARSPKCASTARCGLTPAGKVLDAKALAEAAKGCEIIVSDRQTPGPAEFFPLAPDCCAFLRVAVDIRNIDVEAASAQGVLVTRATPGFMASVSEMAIGMMIDCARGITDATIAYRKGEEAEPRMGRQLHGATVGIMGYGAISHHLAPICLALGMHVLCPIPTRRFRGFPHPPGAAGNAAGRVRLRGLPRRRQRADREPDERCEFCADEEVAPTSSTCRAAIWWTRPRCSPRWTRN